VRQRPAAFPLPPGQLLFGFEDREGGAMASDITLVVGDGARHITHDELAQAGGVSLASARAILRNSAETPDCADPRPAEAASYGTTPTPVANCSETDPLTAIAIQTLSQAVEMLRQDVEHARDRANRAEAQVEVEGQLVEQVRKRVEGLLIELAEARAAAMISGCEAAVLRTQLATLTERRPWWRRRFR